MDRLETSETSAKHDPHSDSFPCSRLIALDDSEIVWHADNAAQDFVQPPIDGILAPAAFFTSSLGAPSVAAEMEACLGDILLPSSTARPDNFQQIDQALATSATQASTTMPYRQPRKPRA